jgi:hypothetical protein
MEGVLVVFARVASDEYQRVDNTNTLTSGRIVPLNGMRLTDVLVWTSLGHAPNLPPAMALPHDNHGSTERITLTVITYSTVQYCCMGRCYVFPIDLPNHHLKKKEGRSSRAHKQHVSGIPRHLTHGWFIKFAAS